MLAIVDNRKAEIQKAIHGSTLRDVAGRSAVVGPFFKAYIANLLPGQFMQPFIDAAFSDLGLDPTRAAAVAAHRPADRPARHPGAAGAVSRAPGRAANRG